MITKRTLLAGAATVGALSAFGFQGANAQTVDVLKIFVPAAPGGGWDQTARSMEVAMRGAKLIGGAQITNVPGAGGAVGMCPLAVAARVRGCAHVARRSASSRCA